MNKPGKIISVKGVTMAGALLLAAVGCDMKTVVPANESSLVIGIPSSVKDPLDKTHTMATDDPGSKEQEDNHDAVGKNLSACKTKSPNIHNIGFPDIWVSPDSSVFVAGSKGVFKYHDNKWCFYSLPPSASVRVGISCIYKTKAIYGTGDNYVVYISTDRAYLFDGQMWKIISDNTDHNYRDVWINSKGKIFIVGMERVPRPGSQWPDYQGIILIIMGDKTEKYMFPEIDDLYGVWGNRDDEVIAVGEELAIYKYDGSKWEKVDRKVTQKLRKKYHNCERDAGGGDIVSASHGFCTLFHVAGYEGHGYYFSSDDFPAPGCIMLRYFNDKISLVKRKEYLCGPIWMDEKGTLYGYNNETKYKLFSMTSKKFHYYFKFPYISGIISIKGLNSSNIFALGDTSISRFDGTKWTEWYNLKEKASETQ